MVSSTAITGLFFGLIIFVCAIILFLTAVLKINSLLLLVIIWILVFFSMIILKSVMDKELENKDWRDISLSTLISVFLIVGPTLLFAQPTIIGRAFENTVGYWWISSDLTEATNAVFSSEANYNYNVIATQLFSDNFDEYLGNMTSADNTLNPFKGITASIDSAELLRELVAKKYNVSKGVIASLATIIALYTSKLSIY
jgi:hypothetical protein